MTLPYDIARCHDTAMRPQPSQRIQCNTCRRREPGHPTRQAYMAPPDLDSHGVCPLRIAATVMILETA